MSRKSPSKLQKIQQQTFYFINFLLQERSLYHLDKLPISAYTKHLLKIHNRYVKLLKKSVREDYDNYMKIQLEKKHPK